MTRIRAILLVAVITLGFAGAIKAATASCCEAIASATASAASAWESVAAPYCPQAPERVRCAGSRPFAPIHQPAGEL